MALTIKIRADASHFKKTIAGVEMQASGLTGVMAKLGGSIPVFGAALSAAAAGAVALGAGLAFIKDASGKAAGMESLTMQFEVLTGSAEKAKSLIKQFRDEAVKSPLNVQDYAQAARTFMGYGMTAEKTLPMLKMLGDISLGNSQRFALLSYAMAQVSSNATLNGEDLRQLISQGFNPLAVISQKTGKSMADLRKEMENHGITYSMVEDAMKQVTSQGGRFFGAIEKGSATTEGKIAKLGDSILGLKVAFGTGFNQGLKSALDATNSFLPQLESRFAAAGDFVGKAITEAIGGDTRKFAALGVLVGTAFWEGFKEVGGNVIVESVRKILQSTAGASDREQELMRGKLTNLLGPSPSAQDMIDNVRTALQPAIEGVERSSTPQGDWVREQVKRVDEQIRLQKEANEKLGKISGRETTQLMFSR